MIRININCGSIKTTCQSGKIILRQLKGSIETFLKIDVPELPQLLGANAWWDSGVNMAIDGSSWTDRIGGVVLTAAGAARPTYNSNITNGRAGYDFDGIDDQMIGAKIASIQNAPQGTLWSVGRRYLFAQADLSNPNVSHTALLHIQDDSITGKIYNGTASRGRFVHTNALNYSVMTFDGTQGTNILKMSIWVNGVLRTLQFILTLPSLTENSNANTSVGINPGFGFVTSGQSLEHGFINRVLSAPEISSLNTYLATKYNL